jgi:NHLM bacteriocin system ABC transporter peptidase/ATP-binding protein
VVTPTILQMEAVECGAAALATVLAYHGRYVPLEELRAACGVSRDGSKASNIVRAARAYGLTAVGCKREPEQLAGMPLPMIVHWNFNHFVVLEGFGDGKAYLNDPAFGPRAVRMDEFDLAFTGVALVFQRGPEFRPGGEPRGLAAALRRRLAGSHGAVAYAALAGLALVIPGLVVPAFSRIFIDQVLVRELAAWVLPLLFVMGGVGVVRAALAWLQYAHLLRLETTLALETSSRFLWHVLRLPVGFFTQRYAGEIGARVGINDRIATLLSQELATAVLNVVMITFYAALMLRYDVWLTLLGVAVAVANLVTFRWVSRRRTDLNMRLRKDRGRLTGIAMSGLQTIETLKANGAESDFFARWAGQQAKAVNGQQAMDHQSRSLGVLPPLLLSVNGALLRGLGGLRIMDGGMSVGMLIAFQALTASFLGPVGRLVDLGSTLDEVKGDLERLDDVLRAPVDPHADARATPLAEPVAGPADAAQRGGAGVARGARLTGRLELRGVTFGYSPLDAPLLRDFDLVVEPGTRVALVGGSGSGKTTIARLVCGLYEPWSGSVLFDGRPRAEVPRGVLASSFAIVDQEIFLFAGTVAENLALWDRAVPESELVRAARDACIHEEIASRPGGYASLVDEGGRNFSGGQRQRLEIARALVHDPALLVLDEATSALDPATEQQIDDNLRRRGCACLIIAHRLSTIRDCDEIIVLDHGRIVQRGTHEALRAAPSHYAQLIAAE